LTVCSAARTTRAVQADSAGRIWLVEDSGGAFGTANPNAKQPNSFVYRFTPSNPDNLQAGGKLEALQVISLRSGNPIVFHDGRSTRTSRRLTAATCTPTASSSRPRG
jgi:hypothetical protein